MLRLEQCWTLTVVGAGGGGGAYDGRSVKERKNKFCLSAIRLTRCIWFKYFMVVVNLYSCI